jgi:hypothetical protein
VPFRQGVVQKPAPDWSQERSHMQGNCRYGATDMHNEDYGNIKCNI